MNGRALCSGIAGLELGIASVIPGYRTVCFCERDAYAAAVLVARMEGKALAEAPIWDDLTTFDGRPWRGIVDLVTAGFPCQPVSVVGKRAGLDDDRWLWPHVNRIICEVGPRFVFLENVPGILTMGIDHVLGSLAEAGYDAEWLCLAASDVGAPHKRERWFCLAYSNAYASGQHEPVTQFRSVDQAEPRSRREDVGDTGESRLERTEQVQGDADGTGMAVAHAVGKRFNEGQSKPASAGGYDVLGAGFPPHRESDRWVGIRDDLEPAVRRGTDGTAFHVDRLRCLGNAVVPLQAATAFAELMRRIHV